MYSDHTFSEELDRLRPVPGVFWGPDAPYGSTAGDPFAPLDWWSTYDKMPLNPFGGAPDHARYIPGRPFVFADGANSVYQATKQGSAAVLDALHQVTGVDVETLFESWTSGKDLGAPPLPTLTTDHGTDAFGSYLPWHAFGDSHETPWGIYIYFENLAQWTANVWQYSKTLPKPKPQPSDVFCLLFFAVVRHELFHYHVERFATRLEVLLRRPVYRPYVEDVRMKLANSPRWLEEALAQAVVLNSRLLTTRSGFTAAKAQRVLTPEFHSFGPGYRDFECETFGGPEAAHRYLAAQVARSVVDLPRGTEATGFATPLKEYYSSSFEPPGYLLWSPAILSQFQLPTPKRPQFERYARKHKIRHHGFGPGDHQVWIVQGKKVHVNYKRGELDLASLKAVARVVGMPPAELSREMRNA
jgi:hypothetical protein